MKLTAAQTAALDLLRALPLPYRIVSRPGHFDVIYTGINTTTLSSLKAKGLITVSRIYLGGHVSPDLAIVDLAGGGR